MRALTTESGFIWGLGWVLWVSFKWGGVGRFFVCFGFFLDGVINGGGRDGVGPSPSVHGDESEHGKKTKRFDCFDLRA